MQKKIICREAHLKDQSVIVKFQLAMALETENLKLDPDICRKGVDAVFKNSHLGKYFVAEKNEKVLGVLLVIPEWSDWRNGAIWWIHSVYVIPTERSQGVFSFLYRTIQEQGMQENAFRGIRLYVDKTNIRAQAVYAKLGMSNHHYELFEWMRTN